MLLKSFGFRGAAALLAALSLAVQPALAAQEAEKQAEAKPQPVVQDYQPNPAIWLLHDEDTKIYMFGTIHMLPPGFKWRSPALEAAVKEADELVVETYIAPGEEEEMFGAQLLPLFILPKPKPILERVPKQHRAALRRQIEASELPLEGWSMMRTWAAAMMLGMTSALKGWGVEDPDDAPGVEDVLEADFRSAKKPILSIEKAEDSIAHFGALTEAQQVELLVDAVADAGKPAVRDEEEEADHHWAKGNLTEVDAWLWKDFPKSLYEGLVVKRNAAWTEWLAERMKKPGVMLLAVGAGHLTGPDSVQKMLEAKGLRAERHR
jgi:hypothetical protein